MPCGRNGRTASTDSHGSAACPDKNNDADDASIRSRGDDRIQTGDNDADWCEPISDRGTGQIPLRRRHCCLGQHGFKDLSLLGQQDVRQDQNRRIYVRARCHEPGNAGGQERETSLNGLCIELQ